MIKQQLSRFLYGHFISPAWEFRTNFFSESVPWTEAREHSWEAIAKTRSVSTELQPVLWIIWYRCYSLVPKTQTYIFLLLETSIAWNCFSRLHLLVFFSHFSHFPSNGKNCSVVHYFILFIRRFEQPQLISWLARLVDLGLGRDMAWYDVA